MPFHILAAATVNTWPFVVLLISVAFVIASISIFKLHPFVSLIIAGILAGVMAQKLPVDEKVPDKGQFVRAVEITIEGQDLGGLIIQELEDMHAELRFDRSA